ncbi:sigma-54 interaction domain-containing protein [Haloimpatiens sp. FM7330]|uniref:sigma-54 interaction domain-containing protein n=1 Tax=Haloimpatiens sp. FM7330 TaxID=3298610 RepID=UPI0036360C49
MDDFIKSEEFLEFCHKTFDNMPVTIDFLDKDGRMLYINNAFADFLQIPREDMVGKIVTDINATSKFLENLKKGKADIAICHQFPNGKKAIVHRIPILNNKGEVVGGFGMIVFGEIAEVKKLVEKFDVINRELSLYKNYVNKFNMAKYYVSDIIGVSDKIEKCKDQVKKFSKVDLNVLVSGESGVGKELFVHAIHNASERKNNPFITINCSAIPENLIESELFGYEKGAFTGAKKGGNIGKFELANNGSIFLDEIGEMPLYMQAKLLRVIQEKEIVRVGGDRNIPIDVRVFSATNRNLKNMVKEGKFRDDLYYRLNVLSLEIPPLRERKDDIPLLTERFLRDFYKKSGIFRSFSDKAMQNFINYEWPGNIRELKNIIGKICVNTEEKLINEKDLPDYIYKSNYNEKYKIEDIGLGEYLNSLERDILKDMLVKYNNNKSLISRKLKIPRISLYRKLEKYNLTVNTEDIS